VLFLKIKVESVQLKDKYSEGLEMIKREFGGLIGISRDTKEFGRINKGRS